MDDQAADPGRAGARQLEGRHCVLDERASRPLDSGAGERWQTDALDAPKAKEKYRALVEQGWTDALRHTHPDERIYTFWHYWRQSFERDAGIRIDHALLSPALAKKLKAAGVDRTPRAWDKTSDHAPMWVDVEI